MKVETLIMQLEMQAMFAPGCEVKVINVDTDHLDDIEGLVHVSVVDTEHKMILLGVKP